MTADKTRLERLRALENPPTRRERAQDAIVRAVLWIMEQVAWFLRLAGRRRPR